MPPDKARRISAGYQQKLKDVCAVCTSCLVQTGRAAVAQLIQVRTVLLRIFSIFRSPRRATPGARTVATASGVLVRNASTSWWADSATSFVRAVRGRDVLC